MKPLKVSKMSGKLKGIASINTSPLHNPFCLKMHKTADTVCAHCYSHAMLKALRANCVPLWKKNGEILSARLLTDAELPTWRVYKHVRFSAHGELFNKLHCENLFKIARFNPDITFALWTKRPELVSKDVPDNCILIYSSPIINVQSELPEGFHKVFTVYDHDTGNINCGGKYCRSCLLCYTKNDVVYINELLK